jgi:hypothetical protein
MLFYSAKAMTSHHCLTHTAAESRIRVRCSGCPLLTHHRLNRWKYLVQIYIGDIEKQAVPIYRHRTLQRAGYWDGALGYRTTNRFCSIELIVL